MSRRRNKITATLVPFLFLTLICVAAIAPAALVDTFDAPLPAATAQADGSGPAPAVQSGGPTGDFLRLVYDGQNSQNNQYAYDQTDAGLFSTIVTQFDFRAFSAAANQAADGFSFALIPTADWGTSGAGPGYTAEEPNIPGMFGLGFDLHPADGATPVNDVSIHFNNVEVHNVKRDPASEIDLDNNQFHRAQLTLQQVGNSTNATLILSPDVYGAPGSPVTAITSWPTPVAASCSVRTWPWPRKPARRRPSPN